MIGAGLCVLAYVAFVIFRRELSTVFPDLVRLWERAVGEPMRSRAVGLGYQHWQQMFGRAFLVLFGLSLVATGASAFRCPPPPSE